MDQWTLDGRMNTAWQKSVVRGHRRPHLLDVPLPYPLDAHRSHPLNTPSRSLRSDVWQRLPLFGLWLSPLPRLHWFWGWTYDYAEVIADLRGYWPHVEERTTLLSLLIRQLMVKANLSEDKLHLDLA
jgi:hypothetical protein